MDELKLIFASNLIRLRTAAGMTQAELGEQLNYSDKSISKWERGEAIPDAAVLKRMSEIFGVTVDYLLDEHDAWQPAPDPADVRDRSHASIIQVALTGIVTLAVLVFVVLCAVLPVYKLWALLVALGGAAVAFGVAKKTCPPRVVEHEVPFHTGVEDVDQMLTDIQQKLDTLHALNEALPDPQLSAAMTRMEKAGRSIVEAVEANPAKAKQVRRFANYYLPDAVNVLQQYAKLAKQGVRGENAAAIRAEVEHNAASIATAFENQLDALYAAESMDLSADLTVLQNMLKGQGLSK